MLSVLQLVLVPITLTFFTWILMPRFNWILESIIRLTFIEMSILNLV